jgi:hypothetical protein
MFIYWKVAPSDAAAAAVEVRRLQDELMAHWPGLVARLYSRSDRVRGSATLMETYALSTGDIDAVLQAEIESRLAPALTGWCQGPRHVECFERLAP